MTGGSGTDDDILAAVAVAVAAESDEAEDSAKKNLSASLAEAAGALDGGRGGAEDQNLSSVPEAEAAGALVDGGQGHAEDQNLSSVPQAEAAAGALDGGHTTAKAKAKGNNAIASFFAPKKTGGEKVDEAAQAEAGEEQEEEEDDEAEAGPVII